MYRNVLTMISLVVVLFAVSCGGGASLPDPGNGNGGGVTDSTAPEIVISGITEGSAYGEQQPGLNFLNVKGVAADTGGVANMAMRINGTLVAASNDSELDFGWDVTGYDDGAYEVAVQASDASGNVAEEVVNVIVDNDLIFIPPGSFWPDLDLDFGIIDPIPDPDPGPWVPDLDIIFPGL
ncbi:MAG: Ig-like domain-containing protein [bacterium]